MRKLMIFLLAAFLFTACNNNDKVKKETEKSESKDSDKDRDSKDNNKSSDDRDRERSDANGSSSDGWTSGERNKFLDECEYEARKNVTSERAREYCSCMLKKIEREFTTYDEANRSMTKDQLNAMAEDCNSVQQ